MEHLGRGLAAFCQFVPHAASVLKLDYDDDDNNNNDNKAKARVVIIRQERALERLKVLVSKFLQALWKHDKDHHHEGTNTTATTTATVPLRNNNIVALFFDDLQWADEGCLEMLQFIAADEQAGVLLIASFRDGDDNHNSDDKSKKPVGDEDSNSRMILQQQLHLLENEVNIVKIHVPELDQNGVNQVVSGLLDHPRLEETAPLAEVVYRKTNGNAFFVTQFLQSIKAEGFLYYSAASFQWKWDLESIESLTQISDNVVEFVSQKIQRLPDSAQAALKLAACLGSPIHVNMIDYIATSINVQVGVTTNPNVGERLQAWIDIFDSLANDGFVNKRQEESMTYMWSHDRILESAYRLISSSEEEDPRRIHWQIGQALTKLDDCPLGETWKLVTSIDQLNHAASSSSMMMVDETERVHLANMNLQAAKLVAGNSEFYQAARYLRAGIDLLDPSTSWGLTHYPMTLELHNSLAEMEKYIGHHDACRLVAKKVLEHGTNLNDQLRSFVVLIDSLGSRGEFNEMMDVALGLSRRLGQPLPRQPGKFRLIMEILRTNRMVGKRTDEELLDLPAIADERAVQVLSLFNRLQRLTWSAGKFPLTIFIRLRMMQLCLRHGSNEFIGPTFALFGTILARLGKLDESYRFGMLALKFSERFPIEETQAAVYVYTHLMIIKKPLSHSIEPLRQAHRVGLEKGDTVMSGGGAYCVFYFYQGLPLEPMVEDARAFALHRMQFGSAALATCIGIFRQLALNFMGRSANFLVLSGEAIDLPTAEQEAAAQKNQVIFLFSWTSQLVLACFSGDRDLSVAMFEKLEKVDLLPEFFPGPAILGLVAVFLARSTGVRKYARRAASVMKQLQGLLKKGCVNYLLFMLLIQAELAVLNRNDERASKSFEAAIRAASQSGFVNFGALATQRYGLYTLERDGDDTFWAETHMSRAVFLYSEWGAQAMVDHIQEKYSFLTLTARVNDQRSTHHMSVRRLDAIKQVPKTSSSSTPH